MQYFGGVAVLEDPVYTDGCEEAQAASEKSKEGMKPNDSLKGERVEARKQILELQMTIED